MPHESKAGGLAPIIIGPAPLVRFLFLPNDHMSTSGPYGRRDITSGDIQYGVPTNDFRLGSSWDTWAQNPKSDNLTCR